MHILRMSKEDISDISKIRNARNIPFVVFRESFWCSILMSQEQDYSLSGEVSRYKGGQKILGRLLSHRSFGFPNIDCISPFVRSIGRSRIRITLFHLGCSEVSLYICSPRNLPRIFSKERARKSSTTRILFLLVCRSPFTSRDEPLANRSASLFRVVQKHGRIISWTANTWVLSCKRGPWERGGQPLRQICERNYRRKSEAVSLEYVRKSTVSCRCFFTSSFSSPASFPRSLLSPTFERLMDG